MELGDLSSAGLSNVLLPALYSSVGRTQLTTTATKKISIVAKSRLNPNLSSSISGLARIARGTWSVDNASIVIQNQVSLQYLRYFRVGRRITAPHHPCRQTPPAQRMMEPTEQHSNRGKNYPRGPRYWVRPLFGVHTHGSIHVRRLVQNTNTPIKSLVIKFDVN